MHPCIAGTWYTLEAQQKFAELEIYCLDHWKNARISDDAQTWASSNTLCSEKQ